MEPLKQMWVVAENDRHVKVELKTRKHTATWSTSQSKEPPIHMALVESNVLLRKSDPFGISARMRSCAGTYLVPVTNAPTSQKENTLMLDFSFL